MLQTTLLIEDIESNEPSILPDCATQIRLSEYHETTPRFESIEMFVHKRRTTYQACNTYVNQRASRIVQDNPKRCTVVAI